MSYAILMTDGYYNGGIPGVGNADANTANLFDGPPYADGVSDTLADVAMYYYKNDLNGNLYDFVPVTTLDTADHQHMVTYTLSFGVEGTIDQTSDDYKDCITGGTCLGSWPNPAAGNSQKIDDMFHAAVNGRGEYMNASSPEDMVDALRAIGDSIEAREKSSAALATNSIQRQEGSVLYQGTYNSGGWWGEIEALEIYSSGPARGTVNTANPIWKASEGVPAYGVRNIISFDGSTSIDFIYGNLTPAQITLLGNNGHDAAELVNYLRGASISGFRVRTNPIGDIVHSAPFFYNDVVYIGANDGMLHAVSAATGAEVFCYVPNMVYDHLSDLAVPGYSHKYYVDGTATAAAVNGRDILVCGLGQGGKGYFGLDITTPSVPSALWEYTNDDDLGYSFSEANIIKTGNTGNEVRVVMFGNGYDSVSETAALFFVDPEDGSLIAKLDTETTGCNGLSTPSAVDMDTDGYMDFVYAGDLHGNLWKFDIRGDVADWKIYYNGGSVEPLITVQNAAGETQPITVAPEVMLDCAKSDFSKEGAGLMVIFATGRYLNVDDFDDDRVQSFYGVWDWGDIWETKDTYAVAKTKYLGDLNTARSLSNVAASLQGQTMTVIDGKWVMNTNNPVNWYDPEETTGAHMGWFMDLSPGERGVRDPKILKAGALELISLTPSDSPCESGGSSIIYRVSPCSGGFTIDPQFDVNGDGEIDDDDKTIDAAPYFDPTADYNNDGVVDDEDLKTFLGYTDWNDDDVIDSNDLDAMKLPVSGIQMENMVFEGIDSGDQRYFSDTEGDINPVQTVPVIMGMQYWRVIQ